MQIFSKLVISLCEISFQLKTFLVLQTILIALTLEARGHPYSSTLYTVSSQNLNSYHNYIFHLSNLHEELYNFLLLKFICHSSAYPLLLFSFHFIYVMRPYVDHLKSLYIHHYSLILTEVTTLVSSANLETLHLSPLFKSFIYGI